MPTLSQETLPKPTTTPSIIKPAASEHTDQLQEPPAPTVTTVRPIVPTTTPTQSPEQLTPEPSEDPSKRHDSGRSGSRLMYVSIMAICACMVTRG